MTTPRNAQKHHSGSRSLDGQRRRRRTPRAHVAKAAQAGDTGRNSGELVAVPGAPRGHARKCSRTAPTRRTILAQLATLLSVLVARGSSTATAATPALTPEERAYLNAIRAMCPKMRPLFLPMMVSDYGGCPCATCRLKDGAR